jgi:hypothetical protein
VAALGVSARRASTAASRAGWWLAVGLLAFVATAVIVISRRGDGYEEEQRIVALDRERRDLDAQRISLEGDLQRATSADRIAAAASRRLGLRAPSDSQIITLIRARGAGATVVDTP